MSVCTTCNNQYRTPVAHGGAGDASSECRNIACGAVQAVATANSAAYGTPAVDQEPVNRFSSRVVAPMSLLQLSALMQKGTDCSDELCIMALVLMVRYCRTTGTALTLKMMHRLYVASLHLAIKTHSDRYFRNDMYAMMAGISTTELNLLESVLLGGLEWRCLVEAGEAAELVTAPVKFVANGIPAHTTKLSSGERSISRRRSRRAPRVVASVGFDG